MLKLAGFFMKQSFQKQRFMRTFVIGNRVVRLN
jgi:hypothetical protein